jgi:hypothetical protein
MTRCGLKRDMLMPVGLVHGQQQVASDGETVAAVMDSCGNLVDLIGRDKLAAIAAFTAGDRGEGDGTSGNHTELLGRAWRLWTTANRTDTCSVAVAAAAAALADLSQAMSAALALGSRPVSCVTSADTEFVADFVHTCHALLERSTDLPVESTQELAGLLSTLAMLIPDEDGSIAEGEHGGDSASPSSSSPPSRNTVEACAAQLITFVAALVRGLLRADGPGSALRLLRLALKHWHPNSALLRLTLAELLLEAGGGDGAELEAAADASYATALQTLTMPQTLDTGSSAEHHDVIANDLSSVTCAAELFSRAAALRLSVASASVRIGGGDADSEEDKSVNDRLNSIRNDCLRGFHLFPTLETYHLLSNVGMAN